MNDLELHEETYGAITWNIEQWASIAAETRQCGLAISGLSIARICQTKYSDKTYRRVLDPIDQARRREGDALWRSLKK